MTIPNAPAEVQVKLPRLCDDLKHAAGSNLTGVILYGSLARAAVAAATDPSAAPAKSFGPMT